MITSSTVTCPHCWEEFTLPIDISAGSASIVYDCEVCCNPLDVTYELQGGEVIALEVSAAQ